MKTVLITGGAGFVGSCLAILFKQHHHDCRVIALDNLKRRGSELNLNRLRNNGVEFMHGDIRNAEDLQLTQIDILIECSAEPSVLAGFISSPAYLLNTNLVGTLNCLELARRCQSQVVFLSTSRVYPIQLLNQLNHQEQATRFQWSNQQSQQGASAQGITEQFSLEGSRSLYGATKLCSELILQEYSEMYGLSAVINRCGVLAGPWQMGKTDQGVIALWVAKHFYRKSLQYIGYGGEGKQVRDILHVDDLFQLLQIQLKEPQRWRGQVYNVGGGLQGSISLAELTQFCQQSTGNKINISAVTENRPADLRIFITDNAKINAATGWLPQKTPERIVQEIAAWIGAHAAELEPILA